MDNVSFDVSQVMSMPGMSIPERVNALTATFMHTYGKPYCNISLHHEVQYANTPFRKMGGDFAARFMNAFGLNPEAFLVLGNEVMVMHHAGTENGERNNHVIIAMVTKKETVDLIGEKLTSYTVTFYVIAPMEDINIYEAENDYFSLV